MKDYRIDVSVKNNLLLSAIAEAGFPNVAQFCKAHNLAQGSVGKYVNMIESPITSKGEWSRQAWGICEALGKMPDELFNEQQKDRPLKSNKKAIEASAEQVFAFMSSDKNDVMQIETDQDCEQVADALHALTEKEEAVLRMRFGFDGPEKTLCEVGEAFGVTQERIRQVEAKALRKLRHPRNSDKLREIAGIK